MRVPAGLWRADGGHAGGHEPGNPGAPVRPGRLVQGAPVHGRQELLLRRRVRGHSQGERPAGGHDRLRRGARPDESLRRLQVQCHLPLWI